MEFTARRTAGADRRPRGIRSDCPSVRSIPFSHQSEVAYLRIASVYRQIHEEDVPDKKGAVVAEEEDDRLLSSVELAKRWGISPQTLANNRVAKVGPRFTKIGPSIVRYRLGDIREYEREGASW